MMWSNIVTRNIRGYGASLLTFGKIGAWCAKVGHSWTRVSHWIL